MIFLPLNIQGSQKLWLPGVGTWQSLGDWGKWLKAQVLSISRMSEMRVRLRSAG